MSNLFDPSTEIFTSLYKFLKNAVNELIGPLPPPAAKITGSDHMKSHGNTKKHSRIGKE